MNVPQRPAASLLKSLSQAFLSWLVVLSVGCSAAPEHRGQLLALRVHGPALEQNKLDVSAERDVRVYLPPTYESEPERRYPALYVLHGFTDPVTVWTEPWSDNQIAYGTLPNLMDRGISSGLLQEMILVMVDARTPFFACHYADSPVKGNWQQFLSRDLIGYVDSSYRTLTTRESRGVMGHSMGGHGAIRLGLDRPDLFSAVYGLSPSLLGWAADISVENPAFRILASHDDLSEYLDDMRSHLYVVAGVGLSQAFSPNPDRPPYYADYPFKLENGELVPNEPAHSQWEANFPVNRIESYLAQPVRLTGLRFDTGTDDEFTHIPLASEAFSEALTAHGVEHVFEIYDGDHRNRLWGPRGRLYTEALPYFSRLLVGDG